MRRRTFLQSILPLPVGFSTIGNLSFDPPVMKVTLSNNLVERSSCIGKVIGRFTASGVEPGNFALVDSANGRFGMDGCELKVAGTIGAATSFVIGIQFTTAREPPNRPH